MPLPTVIDETHDPALQSWVAGANQPDTDFPIQNLPYGRFRLPGDPAWRIGVAIGDQVLDLAAIGLIPTPDMMALLALDAPRRRALRLRLSQGLRRGSPDEAAWSKAVHPLTQVTLGVPCEVGDYTDFYIGIHHATAIGKLFRPDNPLLPNYRWVPIGYHGRASTIVESGRDVVRPTGQILPAGETTPQVVPCKRLDFELELGVIIGRPNAIGQPIPMQAAEDHVVGITLFNDWSARDIQAWEYQPLGPFLSKSFASTISPWIVTLEALAPFRRAFSRAAGEPEPLPYLDSEANRAAGAIDIAITVTLQTDAMRRAGVAPVTVSRSNFADAAYWTVAQLVAHHTVNGCALRTGDLFGTGTLSGSAPGSSGSMLELSGGGKQPIPLPGNEQRTFLEDGDCIALVGRCSRDGFRSIGFGPCSGTIIGR